MIGYDLWKGRSDLDDMPGDEFEGWECPHCGARSRQPCHLLDEKGPPCMVDVDLIELFRETPK